MRFSTILLAAICGVIASPSATADESGLSCAELAAWQAERQFDEENAAREDRQTGIARNSELRRDLMRLDAESYRQNVYEDCSRLRSIPEAGQTPPRDGG